MFATPLGLLALLAVPAVLALHLLRRRSRTKRVAALDLWADLAAPPAAGRRIERLQRSASLWLELAAALLLGLALGGPRGCASEGERHLVVVLDAHASLLAVGADGRSAHERALDELGALLDGLGAGDTVTWVESGASPRILGEAAASVADARGSLALWRPALRAHELERALGLARELAHARRAGERVETWLATDRFEVERWSEDVGLLATGERADNVAIVGAWRGALDREAGHERVEVTLANAGRAPVTVALVVRELAASTRATRTVAVAAGGRAEVALEVPLRADLARDVLVLELETADGAPLDDALDADDRAWIAPEHVPELVLAADADEAFRRALGLGGDGGPGGLDGWVAVAAPARVGPPDQAHLVLTRETGSAPPRAFTLRFRVQGDERAAWVGPFLAERGHPLLAGVEWRRALWTSSAEPGALSGDVLVSAGDHPLVAVTDAGGGAVVELDVDIERSTWLRGPDWPILLANLAAWRRSRLPAPLRVDPPPGGDVVVPEAPAGLWRLVPGGARSEAVLEAAGELRLAAPREPGALVLEHAGQPFAALAVSLVDAAVSDLSRASSGRREPLGADPAATDADGTAPAVRAELSGTLLALALAAVALDWLVLARGARRRPARAAAP